MSDGKHHDDTHSASRNAFDPRIDIDTLILRPEERLVSTLYVELAEPKQTLSALEALQLLAGVSRPEDIGKMGPVVASRIFSGNEAATELRLYEVVFGRDSLIVARFVFDQFPLLTRSTALHLAALQGVAHSEMAEEEPGKIIHEARPPEDPIAISLTQTRGWQWPYYGSVDATPLFISAVSQYTLRHDLKFLQATYTARDGQTKTMRDSLMAALAWLTSEMDENPERLLESHQLNKIGGNMIQSWKDSLDSHHHADGSLPNFSAGIASIEVQGLAYDALHDAADLLEKGADSADHKYAAELKERAERLRKLILDKFWIEDAEGGFFALGSDRDSDGSLRLLDVRASNMGHLLNSRLLEGSEKSLKTIKEKLVKTLFSPILLSKRGIRTLATHENRYRPRSYHNGSVWAWDNTWISLGLLRHGYREEAQNLWKRTLRLIETVKRYPEFVSGDDNDPPLSNQVIRVHDVIHNFDHAIEQTPQEIQAWTVASVVAIEHLQKKYGRVSQ